MKLTNIKNIVIWTLVLLNLFFLAFYLAGVYIDGANKAQSLRELGTLLLQNGITVDMKNIHDGGVMPEYATSRDEDSERELAETILGPTIKEDEGGNIIIYIGEKGQAEFLSGGDFLITLDQDIIPAGGDARAAVEKLLKTLQIEAYSITADGETGGETVTAVCAVNGRPIYNCHVDMTFEEGSLVKISGKLAANITATSNTTDMSSPATALMIFIGGINKGLFSCTHIDSAVTGYTMTETDVPGDGILQPVWQIDADSGVFYINTVTRKTEQSIK